MARSLSFSNGTLSVRTNQHGLVDELYFPHVGLERQSRGATHRIGVYVDGRISWVEEPGWVHKASYSHGSLIGQRTLVHQSLGLIIELEDAIQADDDVFIRNLHIINTHTDQRAITVFLHQAFHIGREAGTDTVQYVQHRQAIVHYAGRRAFAVSGMTDVGQSFDQHTVGRYGNGLDGTWRDAEDGELSGAASDCGMTDSVIRFSLMIGGLSSRRVHYWLGAGMSAEAATLLVESVRRTGVHPRVEDAIKWRRRWLSPAFKVSEQLPSQYRRSFIESLMSLQTAMDHSGSIVSQSATASAPLFCIPRVGAYAVWPLARLGYKDETQGFLAFCRRILAKDGYLLSGYGADGSVAPMTGAYDRNMPPIQSDQTAMVLFVVSQMSGLKISSRLLAEFYDPLIKPAANFLTAFTDGGLPCPSYDFSRDTVTVSTYTVGATYAALLAGADMAERTKDQTSSVKWRMAAEDMYGAFREQMYDEDGTIRHALDDTSVSISSLFGAFMFGLVAIDDPVMLRTVEEIERTLTTDSGLFGSAETTDYVGSLWIAQYYMEVGREDDGHRILDLVREHIATGSVDANSDATWAHAEYINTLLDTLTRA